MKTADTTQATNDSAATGRGAYARVNGINMYYEIRGNGKPLVLIHGGGSTIQSTFGTILPMLAKNRQTIAVELQAHGRTDDRDAPESFEQDADDVAALLKSLKIEKADIYGFSNGANTTMQLSVRHPELVNKIILASGFYKRSGMQPGFWEGMKQATIDNMPQGLKDAYAKVAPHPENLHIMFRKDRDRMLSFKDWSDATLKSIKAPALILSADQDVMTPEHAVEMYRLIPHCRLAIFPGGHGSYMGEAETVKESGGTPLYVAELVNTFLE